MQLPGRAAASALAALLAALLACTGSTTRDQEGDPVSGGPRTGGDGGSGAAEIVDTGPQFLDECRAHNSQCASSDSPDCGKCQYRIRYDARTCSRDRPCDNLFLYFAAGGCDGPQMEPFLDGLLRAHPDFATACVQPLYPGQVLPATLGAPERENAVLPHVFSLLREQEGVWTGKNMLVGGCSYGASRYPVVAARYPDDANWTGSEKTAACFSDGVISVSFQDRFIGEAISRGTASCIGRHQRIAEAYTLESGATPQHSCTESTGGQCACDPAHAARTYPGDCGDGDCVDFDSIMRPSGNGFAFAPGLSPQSFAIQHWKLLAEGGSFSSGADRCEKDVVPAGPLRGLCAAIDASKDMSCEFVDRPDDAHCEYYNANVATLCLDWFKKL